MGRPDDLTGLCAIPLVIPSHSGYGTITTNFTTSLPPSHLSLTSRIPLQTLGDGAREGLLDLGDGRSQSKLQEGGWERLHLGECYVNLRSMVDLNLTTVPNSSFVISLRGTSPSPADLNRLPNHSLRASTSSSPSSSETPAIGITT
jgi:hypothetical protein